MQIVSTADQELPAATQIIMVAQCGWLMAAGRVLISGSTNIGFQKQKAGYKKRAASAAPMYLTNILYHEAEEVCKKLKDGCIVMVI